MPARALADIAEAFLSMAHRIGVGIAATTGSDGHPASRPVQPVWEWDGHTLTGWLSTMADAPKVAHLRATPSLSVTYWEPGHDTCTADCDVDLVTDDAARARAWQLFASTPPPAGFDPSAHPTWDSPGSPTFGVLRLTPNRLRVMPGTLMRTGVGEVLTWRRARERPGGSGQAPAGDRLLFRNVMAITPGHLEPFRVAIQRAVDFAERHGPQLMVDVFIDGDGGRATSLQLYADSDAVLRHWQLSDPYIRAVMDHCRVEHFDVYGQPDHRVTAGLAGGDLDLDTHRRLAGFLRHTEAPAVPVPDDRADAGAASTKH